MNLTQVVDTTLKSFRHNVPEYVGSGLVDLSTGMLLDADTVDDHDRETLDVLAAAAADLFRGRTASQIEELWRTRTGRTGEEHYFQEVLIHSDEFVHLFLRSRSTPDFVAGVICRRTVNLGMLFAQARQVMRELDDQR